MPLTQKDINDQIEHIQQMAQSSPFLAKSAPGLIAELNQQRGNVAPDAPELDPNAKQALEQQKASAEQFRAGIPAQSKFLTGQYTRQARRNLAQDLTTTKRNYNARGLLYGGQRLGTEAQVQNNAATDYATNVNKINQGLLKQANQLDQGVVNSGFGLAGLGTPQYGADLNNYANNVSDEIQGMKSQNQYLGAIGGAAGQIAGNAVYASQNPRRSPNVLDDYYAGAY